MWFNLILKLHKYLIKKMEIIKWMDKIKNNKIK